MKLNVDQMQAPKYLVDHATALSTGLYAADISDVMASHLYDSIVLTGECTDVSMHILPGSVFLVGDKDAIYRILQELTSLYLPDFEITFEGNTVTVALDEDDYDEDDYDEDERGDPMSGLCSHCLCDRGDCDCAD